MGKSHGNTIEEAAAGNLGLTFGVALEAVKAGKRVARAGWNGRGMSLHLNKGAIAGAPGDRLIDGISSELFEASDLDIVTRLPNVNMTSASGATVTGWLASQTDMLAEDWEIL